MKTQCPNCSAIFDAPNYYVGRDCRCMKCHKIFISTPYIQPAADQSYSVPGLIEGELPPDANDEPQSMITTQCPTCNIYIKAPACYTGKFIVCPSCSHTVACEPKNPDINTSAVAFNERKDEEKDNKPEPKPKTILQQYTRTAIKSAFDAMTVCYILMAGSFVMIGWLLSELNFNMGLSIFAAIFCSLIWFIPVAFLKLLIAIASK